MSSKANHPKRRNAVSPSTPTVKRLNVRALSLLVVVALVVIPGFFFLVWMQGRASRPLYLVEAKKAADEERYNEALRQVNAYLKDNTADLEALGLKAKILDHVARDGTGLEEAIRVQNQILSLDPKRQDARKRLIELNLRIGQFRAAQAVAEEYLKANGDAEAHRLMGHALEGVGNLGDSASLDRAIEEYEIAEKMKPGDIGGGLRLAMLYRSKGKDPKRAAQVMDSVLEHNPKSPVARLARFQFIMSDQDASDRLARAMAEIDEALKVAPGNAEARLIAAEHAVQRGKTAEARQHLAAINPPPKNELQIKFVTGLIELQEQHDDAAIETWRSGLIQTNGSDADLTWKLARLLLDRGRIHDAEPLIAQYRRLIGGNEPSAEYRFLDAIKLTKTGRPADAIKELEAIRDKINRDLVGQHLFVLGTAYESTRDETKAMDAYRRATLRADSGSAPWLAIARIQAATQTSSEAVSTLERGLAALPNDPRLLTTLAQLLWQQETAKPKERRDWKEFDRWLQKAEQASLAGPNLTIIRADYLAANGELDASLKLIEDACAKTPGALTLWLARVNLLTRLSRADEALSVLGLATKAVGESAVLRTVQVRFMLERGEIKGARDVLVQGLDKVPTEQRPLAWKSLGEFYQNQRDYRAAQGAFEEWSKLQPDSPEPRLALLNLAAAANDQAGMAAQVEKLKSIGGEDSLFWKNARCEFLLQIKPTDPNYRAADDQTRLAEVEKLVKEIKAAAPWQPAGLLLEGRLLECRKQTDAAIAAYEKAVELRGGQIALRPLVVLLARENRNEQLDALHKKIGSFPPEIDKLAGEITLRMGNASEAERLTRMMTQGDPQSLDAAVWQAKVLNTLGKSREAEETLKLFTQQRPEDPSPWLQLLMFQISRREFDAAKATIETMKQRVKTDRPELLWANCYRALGAREQADASFKAALDKWPNDLTVRRAAIDYYELAGRPELAELSLRQALKINPGLDWARRRLAMLLSSRLNDTPALSEAMSLVSEDPKGHDTPDDRLNRALVYARSSDPRHRDEAIRILEKLAIEMPNSTRLHEVLARSLLAINQTTKAREHARIAATVPEANVDSILLFATLSLTDKDVPEAERQLARLAAISPKALPTIELGARIAHVKGDDAKAVADLKRAFDDHKSAPEGIVIGIGVLKILLDLKLFDATDALGAELAKIGPNGQIAYAEYLAGRNKLADARIALEAAFKAGAKVEAARTALKIASESEKPQPWLEQTDTLLNLALKEQPNSIELLQVQAFLRHLQGKYPEEIQIYQGIIDRKPSNYLFMNNMAWTLSEEMGKPQEGLDRINDALKRVGLQAHLSDTRGVILLRLGRVDEAIKDLESAAAALPTAPVYFHLARAYHKAGKTEPFEKYRDLARKVGIKPEQLQPSERDEASKLIGFASTPKS